MGLLYYACATLIVVARIFTVLHLEYVKAG